MFSPADSSLLSVSAFVAKDSSKSLLQSRSYFLPTTRASQPPSFDGMVNRQVAIRECLELPHQLSLATLSTQLAHLE